MEVGDCHQQRGRCFWDRNVTESVVAALSLVVVALVVSALLGGWRSTDKALYADPLGCRTQLCARMTTSRSERQAIKSAIALVTRSAWATTAQGRPIAAAMTRLSKKRAINVWSFRQAQHSRFDADLGIMINRLYDNLDAELIAVMIVHEATHQVLGESTYAHEVEAYENMLAFYGELSRTTGWSHRELAYLAEINASGGIAQRLPCASIFRGDCEAVR